MRSLSKVHAWKQSRTGLLITGTLELVLAYIFGSLALDSGSFWHYLLALVFFIGAVQSFFKAIRNHAGQ